jgi:hypothetical protein
MVRRAWWTVGIVGLLLVAGLLSGFLPLTRVGAFAALVGAWVVVLEAAVRYWRARRRPSLGG